MCDLLKVINFEHWSSLMDLFARFENIIAKTTMKMQIFNMKKYPDLPLKIYAPDGDPSEGVVLIWKLTNNLEEICVFCLKDDKSKLKQSLINTKLIDLNSIIIYCNLAPDVHPVIFDVISHLGLERIVDDTVTAYITADKAKDYIIQNRSNVSLKIMGLEFAEEVNEVWPHKYDGSIDYFKKILSLGFGTALINKINDELIGWIFTTVRGDLHHLYIKKVFRHKGYAEFLIKVTCKKLAEKDMDIFAFIMDHNDGSRYLFEKCGFQMLDMVRWFVTGKNVISKE